MLADSRYIRTLDASGYSEWQPMPRADLAPLLGCLYHET
jgi:hypothetical protein